jgi:hypothetical protein
VNKFSSWVGIFFFLAAITALAQNNAPVNIDRPNNDPATGPMTPSNAVPEGTIFLVRLQDKLDAAELRAGQHFKVKLDEDLISANGNVIPRGKKIKGHVSSVAQGLHPRLLLSFDEIETNHGWVALIATVTGVPGEHGVKVPGNEGSEGEIERQGPTVKQTIADAAARAALGSGVGTTAGDGNGSGGAAGAVAGAKASLLANRNLQLEKGTALEVRLDRALQIPSH